MAERPIAPVLKTGIPLRVSRVRIPVSPLFLSGLHCNGCRRNGLRRHNPCRRASLLHHWGTDGACSTSTAEQGGLNDRDEGKARCRAPARSGVSLHEHPGDQLPLFRALGRADRTIRPGPGIAITFLARQMPRSFGGKTAPTRRTLS